MKNQILKNSVEATFGIHGSRHSIPGDEEEQ